MIRLILSLLLLFACSADAGMQVRRAGLGQSAGVTPIYHNQMDSTTDPHNPLIGVSTNVYGSPSISGSGIDLNSGTKSLKANALDWTEAQGTIVATFRPHYSGFPSTTGYIVYNDAANLYMRINTDSFQCRYGSADMLYYTSTALQDGVSITVRYTWQISGANVIQNLYINENATAVATATTAQSELTTAPDNLQIGDYATSGGLPLNAIFDDLKIYSSVETP